MVIDVHLTDWRTVMRFASRGPLVQLVRRDPQAIDEDRAVRVWINREQGEGFQACRVQYLRKHVIALVVQVPREERDAFLAEHAPDYLERILEKEAAREATTVEGARA
jgi:uncharacterized protein YehS (DUF1456 family)